MDVDKKRTKIIKRYNNRKLYDTQESSYVVLNKIAKMVQNDEEVMVIDNKTKNNITAATLTQIIFDAEKKSAQYAPVEVLRKIIQSGDGSMSSYLAALGVFPKDYVEKQQVTSEIQAEKESKSISGSSSSNVAFEDVKQTLVERVANKVSANNGSPTTSEDDNLTLAAESNDTLLPNSNKEL